METKIYDKETGTTIYMEGTFANLTARIEDEDGDAVFEFKNGHLSEFNQIVQNLGNMSNEPEEYEEHYGNSEDTLAWHTGQENTHKFIEEDEDSNESCKVGDEFVVVNGGRFFENGEKVVLDSIAKDGIHLYKRSNGQKWFADSDRLKRIEEVENNDKEPGIKKGTLCVVNTDNPDYYLKYDKGTIIEFIEFEDDYLPYHFINSKGNTQYMDRKDFDILEEQRGTKKRFEFAKSSKILLTEDTDFAGVEVKLVEESTFIEDDENLFIAIDDKDGVPLIRREKDAKRSYEDIDKFIQKEDSTEKIEVGDAVKVKEGKERRGAKGIAVVSDIVGEDVYLKGYDKFGKYDEEWINNIKNVTKEF